MSSHTSLEEPRAKTTACKQGYTSLPIKEAAMVDMVDNDGSVERRLVVGERLDRKCGVC